MSEKRDIVVLGASWGGLPVAHYSLRNILPKLPNNGANYRVVLVSPSENFYYRVAAPRAVASAELMPDSRTFISIPDSFKQYDPSKFTFIVGSATAVDMHSRTVTVSTGVEEKPQILHFHALVIATGTRTPAAAFSLSPTDQDTKNALADLRTRLPKAKSVIIIGGGPVGVETAGEIGEQLNGAAGWFKSRPENPKAKITILTRGTKLLPVLRESLSKKAEVLLNRVGVDVLYKHRVVSTTENADGTTSVHVDNGSTFTADVCIYATGASPNTSFLPSEFLNEAGFVKAAKSTRVDNAGPRVFAVGDVASYTRRGIMDVMRGVPVALTNLQRDLFAAEASEKGIPEGKDKTFEPNETELQMVPIGRSKGVGALFGWALPSFFVWLLKGQSYFIWNAQGTVDAGMFKKEIKWTAPSA